MMREHTSLFLIGGLSLLLTGCARSPIGPTDLANNRAAYGDGTVAVTSDLVSVRSGPRTRAVLNRDKKVAGVRFLNVDGTLFDVVFSDGGLSYNQALSTLPNHVSKSLTSFASSVEAMAAVNAVRRFFNTSVPPITADDAGWDVLLDNGSRGDVVVPYAVTSAEAPYAYTGWDATQASWIFSGTFVFERDRQLTSAATWAFFTPAGAALN